MTSGGCPYIPTKDPWFRVTYNGKTTKWAKLGDEYPCNAVLRQLEHFGFDLFAALAEREGMPVKNFKKFVDNLDSCTVSRLESDFILQGVDSVRCPHRYSLKNGDFGLTWEVEYRPFAYIANSEKDFFDEKYGRCLEFEGEDDEYDEDEDDDWTDEEQKELEAFLRSREYNKIE